MMMTENMVVIRNVDGSTSVHSAMEALAILQSELDAARAEVVALSAEVETLRELIAEGVEAFRLTKEYINVPDEYGFVPLPDVEGWSHWDWTVKAQAILSMC